MTTKHFTTHAIAAHREIANQKEHRGYWSEYAPFPIQDWKYEVANNDTREGYWDWAEQKLLDQYEDDEEEQTNDTTRR